MKKESVSNKELAHIMRTALSALLQDVGTHASLRALRSSCLAFMFSELFNSFC
jgi:hypothetical protein